MARQQKRVYCLERWGQEVHTVRYYDGLNYERPEFLRDVACGRFSGGYAVAQTFEYGIQLVREACRLGNCELVFTEKTQKKRL